MGPNLGFKATGLVMPGGTMSVLPLEGDKQLLEIETVTADEIPEAMVVYPDGFRKWHQASDIVELMGKIGGTLRGRHGVVSYTIDSMPGNVEPGKIELSKLLYDESAEEKESVDGEQS